MDDSQKETNANNKISLSIFFPCYNEQESVESTTQQALSVAEKISDDYEVIIVNDGSKDNTSKIADKLADENPNVKVVNHPTNLGYGAALQSGFKAAEKEFVFYTDGDGQFDMNELPGLLPLLDEYDIVSGYRINRQDNLLRRINGYCWTKLVCLLFGMKIRDIDSAFKIYKKDIFENITLTSTGALIDAEIFARSIKKGYTVIEKPVHHYPRKAGSQTGAKISVILRAFKELFELRRKIDMENKN